MGRSGILSLSWAFPILGSNRANPNEGGESILMSVLIDRPTSELINLAIEGQHYGFGDNSAIIPPFTGHRTTKAGIFATAIRCAPHRA